MFISFSGIDVYAKDYSFRIENYAYSTTTGVCNTSQTFAYSTTFGIDSNFKTGKMGYGSANISGQMSGLGIIFMYQLEKSTKYSITLANPNGWLLSNFDYVAITLNNDNNNSCGNIVKRITNVTKSVDGMYLKLIFTTTNDTFNAFGIELDNLSSGKYLTPTPNFRLNPYALLINENDKQSSDDTNNIIDNNNQNTQDIIDNQNKTSEEIKDTINSNLNSCRKSSNLLPYKNVDVTNSGIRVVGQNGVYSFTGTWNGSSSGPTFDITQLTLQPGTYTLTVNRIGSSIYPYVLLKNNGNLVVRVNTGTLTHFTLTETTSINQIQFYYNSGTYNSEYSLMLNSGDTSLSFEEYGKEVCSNKLDEQIETSKGILGTLKNVFNSILELPKKLVDLLLDALKSLFVPDSDELQTLIDNFKSTISEKLGLIYESGDLLVSIFQNIIDDDTEVNSCLTFPEVKLPNVDQPIISETNFCFETITDEIPILLTTLRGITGILITIRFVNMLKRKYDDFVNGGNL